MVYIITNKAERRVQSLEQKDLNNETEGLGLTDAETSRNDNRSRQKKMIELGERP